MTISESKAQEKIRKARTQLLLHHPLFGSLATYLQLREVSDEEMEQAPGTIGTNGEELVYTRGHIEEQSVEELQTDIAHEVMHLGLGHLWRKGSRRQLKWNVATDYIINNILDNENMKIRKDMLLNHQYDGMSSEEIYSELPDPPGRGTKPPKCPECGSENVTRKKLTIEDDGTGKAKYKCEDCGHEWEEDVIVKEDKSSRGGKQAVPWEEIEDHRTDSHERWDETKKEKEEKEEETEKLTPSQKENLRQEQEQEWRRRLTQAEESARMQGNVPAGMKRLIENLTEPKLDWRVLLRRAMQEIARNDYTYKRPKERYGVIYPTLRNPEVKVAVALDTSGSISQDELSEMMSEIKGIADSFDEFKMLLMAGDTQIEAEEETTSLAGLNKFSTDVKGGGGTDYRPFFEEVREKGDYDLLVLLGDSYGEMPKKRPDFSTIWVFTTKEWKKVPFGKVTVLDK